MLTSTINRTRDVRKDAAKRARFSLTALTLGLAVMLPGCGGAGKLVSSLPPVSSDPAAVNPAAPLAPQSSGTGVGTDAIATESVADGASASYPMSDTGSILTDISLNHVNGTQGSAVVKHVAPLNSTSSAAVKIPGGAYNPNAFNWTPPKSALQPSGAVTVEMWVNLAQLNASGQDWTLLAYGEHAPAYILQLRSPYDQLIFAVQTAPGVYVNAMGTTRLAPGQTYHIVGTYDGTKAQLYLNGFPEGAAAPGTGRIYYGGVGTQYGLAIGGRPVSTVPQIDATVGHVAIYPSALSPTTIEQHYVNNVGTPTVTVTPVRSQEFVDSIGVNTHFGYQTTQWDTHYSQIKSMLVAAGIKHVRDRLVSSWTTYYDRTKELAAAGIHGDGVIETSTTASQIRSSAQSMSGFLEAFEGLNEPDLLGGSWVTEAQNSQKLLWNTVKSTPSLAAYPVIGTDVTSPQAAQELGNLRAYMDYGNLHNYYNRDNPGNTGTGVYHPQWGGWGGSAPYNLTWVKDIAGTKPVMTTETGYSTASTSLNQTVQAKYVSRLYLEQFRAGIKRSYIYEFADEPYVAGNSFCYNGLITTNYQPKASYYAVQSMIATLADPGASFTTTPLSFAFKGDIANLHYLVMQRHDGTYQIAYWLEVQDWNPSLNVAITHPTQSVSIALPFTPTSASNTAIDNGGHRYTSGQAFSNGVAQLTASDNVSILSFHR